MASPTADHITLVCPIDCNLSTAGRTGYKKTAGQSPRRLVIPELSLLNGDDALHAQCKMRRTMVGVLARFDLGERDSDRFAGVHFHVTR
jgi:hypothetical protein